MSFDYNNKSSNNNSGYSSGFTGTTSGHYDAPTSNTYGKGVAVNYGRKKRKSIMPYIVGIAIILVICVVATIVLALFRNKEDKNDYSNNITDKQESVTETMEQTGDNTDKGDDNEENMVTPSDSEESSQGAEELEDNELLRDYYYDQLNVNQKKVYRQLKKGLLDFQTRIYIDNISTDEINSVTRALRFDNPDIFWINGNITSYSSDSVVKYVEVDLPINVEKEYKLITTISDDIIESIPKGLGEYERIKYIYDWIVENVDYAHGERDQDVRSTLIDGSSVCHGYASTFKLLCKKAGITCATVSGYADNGTGYDRHAWNLVYIDGSPYWVDVTWGDPLFSDESGVEMKSNYVYLCMSDEEVFKTHTIDNCLGYDDGETWEYPKCSYDNYNYYKRNGMYFEDFDYASISDYIVTNTDGKKVSNIEMQFGTYNAYADTINKLFTEKGIWEILKRDSGEPVTGMVWHSYNDKTLYLQIRIELD